MKETKFKNTEIGRIPEEWETCTILSQSNKLVVAFVGTCEKYYTNKGEGVMMLRTGDLKERSIDYTNIKYISYSFHNANKKSQLKKGDILIARHGSNGHGVIYDKNDEANSLNFVIVHLIDNEYLNSYLVYCLDTNIVREQIEAATAGSTQKVINTKAIGELIVPKPNILEQQRIASALTSIDNLISSLGKLIEKKKNIKQGAMQQLLTGKIRLKEFNEPWVKRKLGDNATIQRGGSPRPIEAYLTTNRDGINWIKIGDVRPNDKFIRHTVEKIIPEGISHSRQVYKGDFILSNSMSFGRPYILDIDGCIHDGWLVIKDYSNTYDMDFLYYILSSDTVFEQYIAMAAGSSVKNLNKEKVANVMLFAPQSLAEQQAIAAILTKMDDEITALEATKTKYEAIKQGMMQQLLTGKIRLIS